MSNNLIMTYNGPPIKWKTDKQAASNGNSGNGWKPGQSGNPRGRPPPNVSLAGALRYVLRQKDPDGVKRITKVALAVYNLALAGNIEAMKLIFERTDGKVMQAIEVDSTQTTRHFHVVYEFADPLEVLSNRASLSAPIDHQPSPTEDP